MPAYPWLEVDEDSPWNVVIIVCLVEEYIFTVGDTPCEVGCC